MPPFQTLVLIPGTLVSFKHTTVSHDGASGSLNTLVLIAVLPNDQCCRMFCMIQFHRLVLLLDTRVYFGDIAIAHNGAAGFLNTLVLIAVSYDGAKGCFLCGRLTRWCCRFFEYVGSRCSFTR